MILSILKENLKQGLFSTSHVAGKNINLPILSNLMVDVKKDGLKILATNLEIGITCLVRGKVDEEGKFTVDAKIFSDYINLLPNKKIDLIIEENNLKIECENYKTKIKIENSDDFPLIPEVVKNNKKTAIASDFRKALSQVVFAVSGNESRLELTGVLFSFNNNKLTLAATDSYRLAEKEIEVRQEKGNQEIKKVIVPAKTAQEILRVLSLSDGAGEAEKKEISFYINDNQILFSFDNLEIVSRLIDGQYPDYKQIIPQKGRTTAIVNRADLARAVKTSSLFSKTGINDISLDFPGGKKEIIISSASSSAGENVVNVEADTDGEDNAVVINYQYLLDGLNNINEDEVKIEVVDSASPCLIKPIKEKDYLYIIMPIKQ